MPTRRYPEIRLQYKRETGQEPMVEEELEVEYFRSKGRWILDVTDDWAMEHNGTFRIPVMETYEAYIEWLEEQLELQHMK